MAIDPINEDLRSIESNSLKDYIKLVRTNLVPVVIITLVSLIVAIIYAINAKNIYKATTSLKVSMPQGNILEAPLMPEFQDFGSDRFIANEIEILKSHNLRSRVAEALIDSFRTSSSKDSFYLILSHNFNDGKETLLGSNQITGLLDGYVTIEQKRGLDIIDISAESPSPFESSLIANIYAKEYKNLNLEMNRNQLTMVKAFLDQQRGEKQTELNSAEETLRNFQEKGGIIALDEQATSLINQLSDFEAQQNAKQIELAASDKVLSQYKMELAEQNPRLADYLESVSNETYIQTLQQQLARLQVNRDMASSSNDSKTNTSRVIKEYDQKIDELKAKLNDKMKVIKAGILASSPEEVKDLSQKIIEEEIKNQSLQITVSELKKIVNNYESKFNQLPKTSIELAKLQRNREALEKLYTLVEEKYQEALINEQSQPGNVLIIDNARRPDSPAKPNRFLIVLIGLVLGIGMAFGYVFTKNYFDNTIKTPEDIQNKNINVLAWIPQIEGIGMNGTNEFEFIVAKKPDSIPSEAFRALRTRIQFSHPDKDSIKTILITSSAPQEGKTTVAINLGGSFAQSNRRTLVVDCDLRKPRIHTVFNSNRFPGLIDYLFDKTSLSEIIRETELPNLNYITSGTIPPNPAEMLESKAMKEFLKTIQDKYDVILLDSPPVIAVTDSEILASLVDASLLVVSAETTESDLLEKSVELIKRDGSSFIGTVLNNFSYKSGYGSYYKYYYYYSRPSEGKKNKFSKT
ncbi:MAG TPA: polysaccharide biosynthesis tyrosine autokinase [Ignavibacteriaceae bacterium]|nr:polysaccharide biosynthesis tyrosine autokinase [Ignavibacteriaceae bacterium]